MRITCKCGAEYEKTLHNIIFRDKDSENCEFCGETLASWNGAVIPIFKLLKRPEAKSDD